MAIRTDEENEKRKEAGINVKRFNCGWGLPKEAMTAIAIRVSNFEPKTVEERRNKRIYEYAFLHDMNAQQIMRQKDPLIVGLGNRSKGKPLGGKSIGVICKAFAPEIERYREQARNGRSEEQKRRIKLLNRREKGEKLRRETCATCGCTRNIELHHIIPIRVGGTDDYFNLVSLCNDCHRKLHSSIYKNVQWVQNTDADKINSGDGNSE